MDQPVKIQTIVRDPKISLTMIAQYIVATPKRKISILKDCKYPKGYVPRFYEMARKLVCGLFEGNFIDQQELYFQEFKRQAVVYRKDAKDYEQRKDGYKNRFFSAKGLEALAAMEPLLTPVLKKYTLKSNLSKTRNAITLNGVRIGAKADMLIFDQLGISQIGFLTFHFSSSKLKKHEAAAKLTVLSKYYQSQNMELNPKSCILIDVTGWRLYNVYATPPVDHALDQATKEIHQNWENI